MLIEIFKLTGYCTYSAAMPSDLAKKKAAKKKEAAKARQRLKKHDEVNGEGELPDGQENCAVTNGEANGGVFIKMLPEVRREKETFRQVIIHPHCAVCTSNIFDSSCSYKALGRVRLNLHTNIAMVITSFI